MIRSILNRSILAATCVLALGQSAHALTSLQQLDPNDSRTVAGQAYQESKQQGETCPYATKVALDASTAATKSYAAADSVSSSTTGGRVRR